MIFDVFLKGGYEAPHPCHHDTWWLRYLYIWYHLLVIMMLGTWNEASHRNGHSYYHITSWHRYLYTCMYTYMYIYMVSFMNSNVFWRPPGVEAPHPFPHDIWWNRNLYICMCVWYLYIRTYKQVSVYMYAYGYDVSSITVGELRSPNPISVILDDTGIRFSIFISTPSFFMTNSVI